MYVMFLWITLSRFKPLQATLGLPQNMGAEGAQGGFCLLKTFVVPKKAPGFGRLRKVTEISLVTRCT